MDKKKLFSQHPEESFLMVRGMKMGKKKLLMICPTCPFQYLIPNNLSLNQIIINNMFSSTETNYTPFSF